MINKKYFKVGNGVKSVNQSGDDNYFSIPSIYVPPVIVPKVLERALFSPHNGGKFGYTDNGVTFNLLPSSVGEGWLDVTYSPELDVIVACRFNNPSFQRFIYSLDRGKTWSLSTIDANNVNFYSICWSPELGKFCAIAEAGNKRAYTSVDGINWVGHTTPLNHYTSIIWASGLGLFIAAGFISSTATSVITSPDGITWTNAGGLAGTYANVGYSKTLNRAVVVTRGNSYYSNNGTSWSIASGTNGGYNYNSVAWSPKLNLFLAVGGGGFSWSSDGITWTNSNSLGGSTRVTWNEVQELFYITNGTQIYKSSNGTSTSLVSTNAGFNFYGATSIQKPIMNGGTKTVVDDYIYHTFTTNGTLSVDTETEIDYLVVGGGAGGGYQHAGGGGAGGYQSINAETLAVGSYPIVVGAGGGRGSLNVVGGKGANSTFNGKTSLGGGGGASGSAIGNLAGSGGSGGGGCAFTSAGPAAGTSGQGFGGGGAYGQAGGGGGASEAGGNNTNASSTTSGKGGDGKIWLNGKPYAGGGGCGKYTGDAIAIGGSGIGGAGGVGAGGAGVGKDAVANTGSGGGGGSDAATGASGGGLGSAGIVIVRYKKVGTGGGGTDPIDPIVGKPEMTGGVVTTSGDYTYHQFNSNGTAVITKTGIIDYLVVGGGGRGSEDNNGGSGGGGGGYRSFENQTITAGSYPIVIGNTIFNGDTSFNGKIADAGGNAGSTLDTNNITRINGGSGGGSRKATVGKGTVGQGFDGAGNVSQAGGGGGASQAGSPKTNDSSSASGKGGNGKTWLNGKPYAGGGGCGAYSGNVAGAGGTGGGASGNNFGQGRPPAAIANTGGGGGGGGQSIQGRGEGGFGGIGVVIIRYKN